jgi:predicted transcriptional regulator
MKNITLKIDDETYRKARILASQKGTSVSAIIRDFLVSLEKKADEQQAEQTRVKRLQELYARADARAKNSPPREPWVFKREECYEDRLR